MPPFLRVIIEPADEVARRYLEGPIALGGLAGGSIHAPAVGSDFFPRIAGSRTCFDPRSRVGATGGFDPRSRVGNDPGLDYTMFDYAWSGLY